jgi:hypothetical protein
MSAITDKLDQIIADCELHIVEEKQKLMQLEAQLEAYLNAREAILETLYNKRKIDTDNSSRSISTSWQQILAFIGGKGEAGASLGEINKFADESGLQIRRESIRSQLSIYNRKEILKRIGASQYQLSEFGLQATKSDVVALKQNLDANDLLNATIDPVIVNNSDTVWNATTLAERLRVQREASNKLAEERVLASRGKFDSLKK